MMKGTLAGCSIFVRLLFCGWKELSPILFPKSFQFKGCIMSKIKYTSGYFNFQRFKNPFCMPKSILSLGGKMDCNTKSVNTTTLIEMQKDFPVMSLQRRVFMYLKQQAIHKETSHVVLVLRSAIDFFFFTAAPKP